MKFNVGDRVVVTRKSDLESSHVFGLIGTIEIAEGFSDYGVRFDNFTKGHELRSDDKSTNGWWTAEADLDLASEMTLLDEVGAELARASQLHKPMCSAHEGLSVITEELRELETEVFRKQSERDYGKLRKEAIQLAAMALRFIVDVVEPENRK